MKATGVVRRIDELGRIVVPKEIRRTLKIKNGTPLEIFCGDNGELILKKYSPMVEIGDVLNEICESVHLSTNLNVLITNMERIIAYQGSKKAEYINKNIDSKIEKLIQMRKTQLVNFEDAKSIVFESSEIKNFAISPILTNGDVYGAIIIFDDKNQLFEDIKLIAMSFADFVGRQIE